MATLADLYPDCARIWIDSDGERIPSVEFECVWRHIIRAGTKVVSSKDQLRSLGNVTHYNEQDSGHTLIKVKGKGWFAIADDHPGVKALARSLV